MPGHHKGKAMLASLLVALGGCSFFTGPDAPSPGEIQEAMAEFSARGGYIHSSAPATVPLRETWKDGPTALDISVLSPDKPGRYPLVVYFPGLGEDATAGGLWRQAWADAGYVVFTAQPVAVGNALKALGPGRNHDLPAIGREYFAATALENRLPHLAWALEEFRRQAASGRAPFANADTQRLALVGYDLGAQAVTALVGGKLGAARPDLPGLAIRAAIALSPSVDLAAGNPAHHYSDIQPPLLVVTASGDEDPYGITSPSLRTALWKYAPAQGKYLLLLRNGSHRWLSGAGPEQRREGADGDGPDDGQGGFFGRGGPFPAGDGGDRLRADAYGGNGGGGGHGGPPGGGGHGAADGFRRPDGPRSEAQHLAAVRDITTAFLDAQLKSDADARRWLDGRAARWLGRYGDLKAK